MKATYENRHVGNNQVVQVLKPAPTLLIECKAPGVHFNWGWDKAHSQLFQGMEFVNQNTWLNPHQKIIGIVAQGTKYSLFELNTEMSRIDDIYVEEDLSLEGSRATIAHCLMQVKAWTDEHIG